MSRHRQLLLFQTAIDLALRQRLKRASAAHIVLAQTGHYRSGFRQRTLVLRWQPPESHLAPAAMSGAFA